MIKWKRQEPEIIPLLEAVLKRLPSEDPVYDKFVEKMKREKAGFYGEQRLDRKWLDFHIRGHYVLLNGLKFENKSHLHIKSMHYFYAQISLLNWK